MMTEAEVNALCHQLNAEAIKVRDEQGWNDYRALRHVAEKYNLRQRTPTGDKYGNDNSQIIFEARDGTLLNCWINAPEDEICDGGMGFDDQTDWYTD